MEELTRTPAEKKLAAPTYRDRLVLKGALVTLCSLIAFALVNLFASPRYDLLYVGTTLAAVILAVTLGLRFIRRAVSRAERMPEPWNGSGEPPLVYVVAVVVLVTFGGTILAATFIDGISGATYATYTLVVGLNQIFVMAARLAKFERVDARLYFRLPGARLLRGTKLGYRAQ